MVAPSLLSSPSVTNPPCILSPAVNGGSLWRIVPAGLPRPRKSESGDRLDDCLAAAVFCLCSEDRGGAPDPVNHNGPNLGVQVGRELGLAGNLLNPRWAHAARMEVVLSLGPRLRASSKPTTAASTNDVMPSSSAPSTWDARGPEKEPKWRHLACLHSANRPGALRWPSGTSTPLFTVGHLNNSSA